MSFPTPDSTVWGNDISGRVRVFLMYGRTTFKSHVWQLWRATGNSRGKRRNCWLRGWIAQDDCYQHSIIPANRSYPETVAAPLDPHLNTGRPWMKAESTNIVMKIWKEVWTFAFCLGRMVYKSYRDVKSEGMWNRGRPWIGAAPNSHKFYTDRSLLLWKYGISDHVQERDFQLE